MADNFDLYSEESDNGVFHVVHDELIAHGFRHGGPLDRTFERLFRQFFAILDSKLPFRKSDYIDNDRISRGDLLFLVEGSTVVFLTVELSPTGHACKIVLLRVGTAASGQATVSDIALASLRLDAYLNRRDAN